MPEKPDTEDEDQLKEWKWKVKSVKKENSELHSQRCDIELKLSVRNLLMKFCLHKTERKFFPKIYKC